MTNTTSNIKITNVTPELAEQWLAKNTHNRALREGHVRGLAHDMTTGAWTFNGEAIKFAPDGTLLDGQHRLAAIVMSGKSIQMLVVFDVDPQNQHTMDSGAKRTPGDMLRLRGEKNYNILAAGVRACIVWDAGGRSFTGRGAGQTVTNSQILRYLDAHPEMRTYAEQFAALRSHIPMPASVGFLAIKLFTEIDAADAEHFFDRLASDEGHYSGEPIYHLRKALLVPKDQNKISYTPTWKLAVFIKAWNKYRVGEEVKLLAYRPGGSNREKFPEPI